MTRLCQHGNGRIQHRTAGGRFRHTTVADFGLSTEICEACGGINPRGLGEAPPEACAQCGAVFVYERCAWSRKKEPRHLGPEDFRDMKAGAFTPCGRPAVACDIEERTGRCAEHVERAERPLTPSEVALAKVLAAWEAWPGWEGNGDDIDEIADTIASVGNVLAERGLLTSERAITEKARSLLDRARKAGVL